MEAAITIPTQSSSTQVSCNGSQQAFSFNFVGDSASDVSVSSIASNGVITLLTTGYTVSLNAAAPNQLWGVGGNITFSIAPANGTQLLIQRTLPLTQQISIQNQGNYYSQVVEQALDTLEMQIQQVASRSNQFQGQWITGTMYIVGDIVQDGANGSDTLNYYICTNANTSGVWATDLANGDWAISSIAVVPSQNQPITLSGAVTGTGSSAIATTLTAIPNNFVTPAMQAQIAAETVVCNPSAISGNQSTVSLSSGTLLGASSGGNITAISLGSTLSIIGTVLNVTPPIMTPYGVGAIAMGRTTANLGGGTMIAGSSLTACYMSSATSTGALSMLVGADNFSGTWQAMQNCGSILNYGYLIFQRTA